MNVIAPRTVRSLCRAPLRSSVSAPATRSSRQTSSIAPICAACRTRAQPPPHKPVATPRRLAHTPSRPHAIESPLQTSTAPKTHYEFFPQTLPAGPPPSGPFQIDIRALRREFLQLQAVAHPDRHPQSLKARAEATSARINEAYKTLQNPLLRAQYLLQLRGINVAEDETAKVEDAELLMEVLETREEIEAVQEEGELAELRQVNEERIERSEGVLERAFKEDDLETAVQEAVRLRYWVNIRDTVDAWEKGKPVVLVH